LADQELKKGFSLSFNADRYGSLGGSLNYAFEKIRLGAFILNATPAMTDFQGAYMEFRRIGSDSKRMETCSVFFPKIYFAVMHANTAGKSFPLLIGEAVPYLYRNMLGGRSMAELKPVSVESASDTGGVGIRMTSSVGLFHEFGKNGKPSEVFVKADVRWVNPDEAFYRFLTGVTPRFTAGFRSEKTAAELAYKPESIGNLLDLNLEQGAGIGNFNVLFTLEAKLLETVPGEKPRPVSGANLGIAVTFVK